MSRTVQWSLSLVMVAAGAVSSPAQQLVKQTELKMEQGELKVEEAGREEKVAPNPAAVANRIVPNLDSAMGLDSLGTTQAPEELTPMEIYDRIRFNALRRQAKESENPEENSSFEGWIFESLRLLRERRGQDLPSYMGMEQPEAKTEGGNRSATNRSAGQSDLFLAFSRNNSRSSLNEASGDESQPFRRLSPGEVRNLSLKDRIRYHQRVMGPSREEAQEKEKSQSGTGLLGFPLVGPDGMPLGQPNQNETTGLAEAEFLGRSGTDEASALATFDPSKESFGPGTRQWFEREDDTLPMAGMPGPLRREEPAGFVSGQLELLERPVFGLESERTPFARSRALTGLNSDEELLELKRPGVDIPLEQYLKEKSSRVRQAEAIQPPPVVEQPRGRSIPTMGVRRGRRQIQDPFDLLGPNNSRGESQRR